MAENKKYLDMPGLTYFYNQIKSKFASKTDVSAPSTASTIAAMTDHNKVYVYTGSETGHTFGDWYFYEDGSWHSGGQYRANVYETDKTLSVADKPADGKKTGDEITDLKSALGSYENIKLHVRDDIQYSVLNMLIRGQNPSYLANLNSTKTLCFACRPNTTYVIEKRLSQRFMVGYIESEPVDSLTVYGLSTNNNATSATVETGPNAKYIVIYYLNAGESDGEGILDSIYVTCLLFTANDKYMRSASHSLRDDVDGLSDDIDDLKDVLYIKMPIQYISDHWVDFRTEPVEIVNLPASTNPGEKCAVISCSEGDKFIINAVGGRFGQAWAFLDANNMIVSRAEASATVENLELTAPANAATLVINDHNDLTSYKAVDRIKNIKVPIQYISDHWVNLSSEPVDIVDISISNNPGEKYAVISCSEGDKFIINAVGGRLGRAWGFLDANNMVLSMAEVNATVENLELTAPANAATLVINDHNDLTSYKVVGSINDVVIQLENNKIAKQRLNINIPIQYIYNHYVNLLDDTIPVEIVDLPESTNPGEKCAITGCYTGDKFIINAVGGRLGRAWAFLDANNMIVSKAEASATVENLELTAPASARILVINDHNNLTSYKVVDATTDVIVKELVQNAGKLLSVGEDGKIHPKETSSGLSEEAKQALLDCFAHVTWIDEHGQDYYNTLAYALI